MFTSLPCPLTLRWTGAPCGQPRAWWIAGNHPSAWLGELSRWRVSLQDVRVLLVPERGTVTGQRQVPAGILVLVPPKLHPQEFSLAQPYRCVAERLYLPVEAELSPPIAEAELAAIMAPDLAILHPVAGLVGFSQSEAVDLASLLAPPREILSEWDAAQEGHAVRDRLESVVPEMPPTVEEILQSDRGDIGQSPLDQLPSSPAAGKSPGRSLRDALRGTAVGMAKKLADSLGGLASRGWLSKMGAWAERQMQRAMPNLQADRMQRLKELMQLLDADPEQGLKFAMPLAGDAHRGRAAGGADLAPRDTDFDLNRAILGGGTPGDPWVAPTEIFQGLYQRYRALAEREMRLGRHRRAAYIYAELLNDFPAAVSALKQGRHFREAAIVLRDRLKNPIDAAQCFVEGGLIQEAVSIYEEHQQFVRAGNLWRRLERSDLADAAFRRAVELCLAEGQRIRGAELLEKELRSPEEALAVLANGWPAQAECLKARFGLLGRLGRHEDAESLVKSLKDESWDVPQGLSLAATFAELSAGYPNRSTQTLAADATRQVAALFLPVVLLATDRQSLVDAVTSLAPADQVLPRDGRRFLARAASAAPSSSRLTLARPSSPRRIREFSLGDGILWSVAQTRNQLLYACGYHSAGGIAAARCAWTEALDEVLWPNPQPPLPEGRALTAGILMQRWQERPPLLLAVSPTGHDHVLHALGATLEPREFPSRRSGLHERLGCPAWFPPGTIGCAAGRGLLWNLRISEAGPVVLSHYSPDGTLLGTRGLFDPADKSSSVPEIEDLTDTCIVDTLWDLPTHLTGRVAMPMVARDDTVYVGLGNTVFVVRPGAATKSVILPRRVMSIAVSHASSQRWIAVSHDRGGTALDAATLQVETRFLDHLEQPSIGFTRDGRLVAAGTGLGVVSRLNDVKRLAEWRAPDEAAFLPEILPAGDFYSGFGLISVGGRVQLFDCR